MIDLLETPAPELHLLLEVGEEFLFFYFFYFIFLNLIWMASVDAFWIRPQILSFIESGRGNLILEDGICLWVTI